MNEWNRMDNIETDGKFDYGVRNSLTREQHWQDGGARRSPNKNGGLTSVVNCLLLSVAR